MGETAQTIEELQAEFALPGVLAFEPHGELLRAQVTTPLCAATVYLHGGHLTHWQPIGQAPVLFTSARALYTPDKAIRGGIPVCFPWFGDDTENRAQGKPAPAHGFARVETWRLAFAALAGEALHLTFTLGPTARSRSFGYDDFRVAYEMIFAAALTLRLSVANLSVDKPLVFEEALHSYFAVGAIEQTRLSGLEYATFLDKTDGFREKVGPGEALEFTSETDRVYPDNAATAVINDRSQGRDVSVSKEHSASTIVWNPWAEQAAKLKDVGPDEWRGFLAVETANVGANRATLAPGSMHMMQAQIACSATVED